MHNNYVILFTLIGICLAYDHNLAQDIFAYSRASYCNFQKLSVWDCTPCRQHAQMQELQVFYNNSNAAQGYCGYDAGNNRIIIAIRGSDDLKNWIQNVNFFFESYRCQGCKVHRGFHNVYEDLSNNLLACVYLQKSNHPQAKVFVTGHSLGAAQATFAAIEIEEEITHVDVFYNYGAPRVGNQAFANYARKTLYNTEQGRITHWKDPIVHLATQSMGFQHHYNEQFYNKDSTSFIGCGVEDDSCSNRFFWPWQWIIKDHLFYFDQCSGCEDNGCDKYLLD